jgi:hypothetical protein
LKEIRVVKADDVTIKPFVAHSFTQSEDFLSTIELIETLRAKSSKKAIKKLANRRDIPYDSEKVEFAALAINMILDEMERWVDCKKISRSIQSKSLMDWLKILEIRYCRQ